MPGWLPTGSWMVFVQTRFGGFFIARRKVAGLAGRAATGVYRLTDLPREIGESVLQATPQTLGQGTGAQSPTSGFLHMLLTWL